MKNTFYALAIVLMAPLALQAEKGQGDVTIQNCAGAGSVCQQDIRVNAIGDKITLAVAEKDIVNLGLLNSNRTIEVILPKNSGTQSAYRFVPSAGESAGEIVTVLFQNSIIRPGTRLAGKGQIKVYRRFSNDKAATWTEIGNIVFSTPVSSLTDAERTIQVTLKQDGTAVYTSPYTKKSTIFLAGTKDLREAADKEREELARAQTN